MNYSIHASSHYGDGLCHRKGYNIHFPDLCQSPQEYGSIRNVDTGCNNRIHHASFFRKFWLPQVQSPHFPSLFHSVCSNRPRNGLKYCIPDIGVSVIRKFHGCVAVGSANKDGNAILAGKVQANRRKSSSKLIFFIMFLN